MKAFLTAALFLSFTAFTAFSDTVVSNQIDVCAQTAFVDPACYAAVTDGQLFNGCASLGCCPPCTNSDKIQITIIPDKETFFISSSNKFAYLLPTSNSVQYTIDAATNSLTFSNLHITASATTTITNFDTLGCAIHEVGQAHAIIDGGLVGAHVVSFMGQTNWVDESLRERLLSDTIAGEDFKDFYETTGGSNVWGSHFSITNALYAYSNSFVYPYIGTNSFGQSSSNMVDYVALTKAAISNNVFGGIETIDQMAGGASNGLVGIVPGAGRPYAQGTGSSMSNGMKIIWINQLPDFSDTNLIRDANLVLHIHIPAGFK